MTLFEGVNLLVDLLFGTLHRLADFGVTQGKLRYDPTRGLYRRGNERIDSSGLPETPRAEPIALDRQALFLGMTAEQLIARHAASRKEGRARSSANCP